jgi:SAM-dependent methyltransferase
MKTRKQDLRDFLFKFGYRIKWSGDEVSAALLRAMGAERFAVYEQLEDPFKTTDFLQSKIEADLVASYQGNVLCDAYHAIAAAAIDIARPGDRIIDLGCWSGALCAWLATVLPQCRICGVDRLEKIISDSRSASKGNYEIEVWDYFADEPPNDLGRFDVLCCSLGIYFEKPRDSFGIDLRRLADGKEYINCMQEAQSYGLAWSKVSKQHANLFSVLRISGVQNFLAFCDGMSSSSWNLCAKTSGTVSSKKQKLPLLHFRRTDVERSLDSSYAVEWWKTNYPLPPTSDELEGDEAAVRFLSLCSRGDAEAVEIVTTDTTPKIRIELGRTADSTYVLLRTDDEHTGFKEWLVDVSEDEIRGWIDSKHSMEGSGQSD